MENRYFKFCLGCFCTIGGVFIMIIMINSIVRGDVGEPNHQYGPSHNYEVPDKQVPPSSDDEFVPTVQDVMVLDTIERQVGNIEKDIDTLHIRINRIEDKIDALILEQSNE